MISNRKALPTGVSSFEQLRGENYYIVDKTMIIEEFLERKSLVTLITRPRRFGKTMNLTTMAGFLDITKDSAVDFENTNIMKSKYASFMNTKPVLFVTFRSAKGDNKEDFLASYFNVLKDLYFQHKYLFVEDSLLDIDIRENLIEIYAVLKKGVNVSGEMQRTACQALPSLLEAMREFYGEGVYLFIDEYDTPFVDSYIHGYYKDVKALITFNITNSLKREDKAVSLAMLTGIQRIAKESVFSGLNNLKVYTVKDEPYSQYFGFTTEETKEILENYELELNEDVKRMYDGYVFGKQEIYNPWSIINYVEDKKLEAYWVNTGSNQMIKEAIKQVESTFHEEFEKLIETGLITTTVDLTTSFYEQANGPSLWGLFVNAGYLTIVKTVDLEEQIYVLQIPNRELLREFKSFTAFYLNVNMKVLNDLYQGFLKKKSKMFSQAYQSILLANPSYHDLSNENSYHMLLLGICLYIQNDYEVFSNREVGKGRCDIILKALRKNLPSYVIEFKYAKKEDYEANSNILDKLCIEAIEQIREKHYDVVLKDDIVHIGLAHYSKELKMKWIQKNEIISRK